MGPAEYAVLLLVIGLRFLLPLTIPYVPIVGVVSCMLLDSADQSIFQQFPAIDLEGYQSYDKALDIYYLTITYLSTYRNWTSRPAFKVSQFLFYYRLVGVVAFELTQIRTLLFIFPNTFEYFFIFYELVRLRWNTTRVGMKVAVVAAALIWIFIKLPQEYWIHIAKLDMTDFIKETLFGVDASSSWSQAIGNAPWVLTAMIAVMALLLVVIWWLVTRKAPPKDHKVDLRADPLPAELHGAEVYRLAHLQGRLFSRALGQKIVLTALVSIIFASMLGVDVRAVSMALGVAVFVIYNAFLSHWLARRGRSSATVAIEFATIMIVQLAIAAALRLLEGVLGIPRILSPGAQIFFIMLLTLIIVFFDRFHIVYEARQALGAGLGKSERRANGIS